MNRRQVEPTPSMAVGPTHHALWSLDRSYTRVRPMGLAGSPKLATTSTWDGPPMQLDERGNLIHGAGQPLPIAWQ